MAALGQQAMADGVGALMDPMQTPTSDSLVDSFYVKPEVFQLPQSHHPVLPSSQVRDLSVESPTVPTGRFPSI